MKYFKFAMLDRSRHPRIFAHTIEFDGGFDSQFLLPPVYIDGVLQPLEYFYIPLPDDFYQKGICDGGGYVYVKYDDGTTEQLEPIGIYNENH